LRQRVFVHGDVSRGLYLADRNKLATSALRVLSEHASTLFLGARPGTYRHVDGLGLIYPYPHNIVFQLLMDFGVIVGALLLVLIVALFMRSLQGVEQKGVADRCCAVVALGLVLLALFNGTYMDYRFAALWLGAALASEVTSPARAELLPTAAMAW
jgi:O-antigen ligase